MTLARRPIVIGVAAAGLLALAFFLGRTSAPTKTVDRLVEVTAKSDTKAKAAASSQTQVATTDTGRATITSTTRRYRPAPEGGCAVAEETTTTANVATASTKVATKATQSAQESESHSRLVISDHLHTSEAAAPRWAIGASVGAGTDLRVRYQGDAAYRVAGGLWVTVTVQPVERAALAGVRVVF